MHSAIYEGWVRHRRFRPVANAFRYPLFMVYLDLAELDRVFACHPLWSTDRPNLAWLRRADHLGDPAEPLATAVGNLLAERGHGRPRGPIRLLTHLRYFGHCFNPVSFYYCYDEPGRRVDTVVAEVNNTPWGQRHCYICPAEDDRSPNRRWHRYRFEKAFHVSPFMPMDQQYRWRLAEPGGAIRVHMENWDREGKCFDATLRLGRRSITTVELTRVLWRYPAMTLKVLGGIHFQALRLWLKGARFYPHPAKRPGSEELAP